MKRGLLILLLISVLAVSVSASRGIDCNLDDCTGLVAVYHLDGASDVVLDSSGYNNGTNNNATRGVSGKIGNAFSFDGLDDFVDTGHNLAQNITFLYSNRS